MSFNEILLTKNNKIVTKYGTTTKAEKPKVLYLRSKAKITPSLEKSSFEDEIDIIKDDFLKYIDAQVKKNKNLDNKYLSNIDISSKSVAHGKVSFLRYDLYLKPVVQKSLIDNKKLFESLSVKLDNKLNKLLNNYGLSCV